MASANIAGNAAEGEKNMRSYRLSGGTDLPVLGLGTWRMGESAARQAAEVDAVGEAITMGYRLIDTAEMYGDGGAETVVGQAVAAAVRAGTVRREELVIVSKVYPQHASRHGTRRACERSLARLQLQRLDLYLLHWRGQYALAETCEAMLGLLEAGLIANWGVSNFDVADLQELAAAEAAAGATTAARRCAVNQVYYSLSTRGPEFDLLPAQQTLALPLMAYSPIDQGSLLRAPALARVAARRRASAAQVALAWLLTRPGVVAIPKAVQQTHLYENLAAADMQLTAEDMADLDAAFSPPRRKQALAVL